MVDSTDCSHSHSTRLTLREEGSGDRTADRYFTVSLSRPAQQVKRPSRLTNAQERLPVDGTSLRDRNSRLSLKADATAKTAPASRFAFHPAAFA